MATNLDKYKSDLKELIARGEVLHAAIQFECYPGEMETELKKLLGQGYKKFRKELPDFKREYQIWYSEAYSTIKQLLPDRLPDFVKLYEKPKGRKKLEWGNYVVEDYLQGLSVTKWDQTEVVGPRAAITQFYQQVNIVKSLEKRFESTLFDIRQLVQADLFDSELDAARELLKNKFVRAAGAVAGVVLERHLDQVCANHKLAIAKKNPNISDLNDLLKKADVYDTAQWRFIQHLGDLRNLCDHNKKKEPTVDEIGDLIAGVEKITKTLF